MNEAAQLTTASQAAIDDADENLAAETSTIGRHHVHMPLTNNQNYGYIGEFYLGSVSDTGEGELQPIRILLDTGSANSWIMSQKALDNMPSSAPDGFFQVFDPEFSLGGTFHEPDEADINITKITFGSGYLKGYFVNDRLTIGNPAPDAPEDERLVLE